MTEIYELIDSVIQNMPNKPEGIQVRYQYFDDTDINTIGIALYEGKPDQPFLSGGYPYLNYSVHLQYSVSTSRTATLNAMPFMASLVRKLETIELKGDGICIESMQHIGPLVIPMGINEHGIGQLSSNLAFVYNPVEVEQ